MSTITNRTADSHFSPNTDNDRTIKKGLRKLKLQNVKNDDFGDFASSHRGRSESEGNQGC